MVLFPDDDRNGVLRRACLGLGLMYPHWMDLLFIAWMLIPEWWLTWR